MSWWKANKSSPSAVRTFAGRGREHAVTRLFGVHGRAEELPPKPPPQSGPGFPASTEELAALAKVRPSANKLQAHQAKLLRRVDKLFDAGGLNKIGAPVAGDPSSSANAPRRRAAAAVLQPASPSHLLRRLLGVAKSADGPSEEVASISGSASDHRARLQQLEHRQAALKDSLEVLESELAASRNRLDAAESRADDAHRVLAIQDKQHGWLGVSRSARLSELQELRVAVMRLEADRARLIKESDDLRHETDVALSFNALADLQVHHERARMLRRRAEVLSATVRNEVLAAPHEHFARVANLQRQVLDCGVSVARCEVQADALSAQVTALAAQLAAAQARNPASVSEVEELSARLAAATAVHDEMQQAGVMHAAQETVAREALAEALDEVNRLPNGFLQDLNNVATEQRVHWAQARQAQRELDSLSARIRLTEPDLAKLNLLAPRGDKRVAELQDTLRDLQEQALRLESIVAKSRKDAEEAGQKVNELHKSIGFSRSPGWQQLLKLVQAQGRINDKVVELAHAEMRESSALEELGAEVMRLRAEDNLGVGGVGAGEPRARVEWKEALERLRERVEATNGSGERDLPDTVRMEALQLVLASVCGNGTAEAAETLKLLLQRPATHWLVPPGGYGRGVPDAVREVFHQMAALPRGIEILRDLAAPPTPGSPKLELDVLQAYWAADRAESDLRRRIAATPEGEGSVGAQRDLEWLAKAKLGACITAGSIAAAPPPLGEIVESVPELTDDIRMALHGVRDGMLSVAPGSKYAQLDGLLRLASTDFMRQVDERALALKELPLRLAMLAHAGPMSPSVLGNAEVVLKALDKPTAKTVAAADLHDAARQFLTLEQVESGSRTAAWWTALRSVASLVLRADADADALGGALGARDQEPLRSLLDTEVSPDLVAPAHELRGLLDRARVTGDVPLASVLNAVVEMAPVDSTGGEDPVTAIWSDELRAKLRVAEREALTEPSHAVEYFEAILDAMEPRERLVLSMRTDAGVGLPPLAFSIFPGYVDGSAAIQHKLLEESFAIESPSWGMRITVARGSGRLSEGKVGGGVSLRIGGLARAGLSLTAKASSDAVNSDVAALNMVRKKDATGVWQTEALNAQAKAAFATLMNWATLQDDQGRAYAGPLDAVLARHDDVTVTMGTADSKRIAVSLGPEAVVRVGKGPLRLRAAVDAPVAYAKSSESMEERKTLNSAETATQQSVKFKLSPGLSLICGAGGQFPLPGKSRIGTSVTGLGGSSYLEVLQASYKSGVRIFSIGEAIGATRERTFVSVPQLRDEVLRNADNWIARCREVLPKPREGEPELNDDALNAAAIAWFWSKIDALDQLARGPQDPSALCTIKDEINPKVSRCIEGRAIVSSAGKDRVSVAWSESAEHQMRSLDTVNVAWLEKTFSVRVQGKVVLTLGAGWGGWAAKRTDTATVNSTSLVFPR